MVTSRTEYRGGEQLRSMYVELDSILDRFVHDVARDGVPDEMLLVAQKHGADRFRLFDMAYDRPVGTVRVLLPDSLPFIQRGIVVCAYTYTSDWEERGEPSPLMVLYRRAPVACKVRLVSEDTNSQYPQSVLSLMVPKRERWDRLSIVLPSALDSERRLAVRDAAVDANVGYLPADISRQLLRWSYKDPHHGLLIHPSWHVYTADPQHPVLEVEVCPYWKVLDWQKEPIDSSAQPSDIYLQASVEKVFLEDADPVADAADWRGIIRGLMTEFAREGGAASEKDAAPDWRDIVDGLIARVEEIVPDWPEER